MGNDMKAGYKRNKESELGQDKDIFPSQHLSKKGLDFGTNMYNALVVCLSRTQPAASELIL
jgi:hypothetical protein